MRRTTRNFSLGLALCVATIATACSKQDEEAAKPVAAFAVSVVRVQARDIPRSVLVSGPVSAWEEMQLGVEVSGLRVNHLLVDVGQQVRKGDLLGLVVDRKGDTLEEIRAGVDGWVVSLKVRPQVAKGEPVVGLAVADER